MQPCRSYKATEKGPMAYGHNWATQSLGGINTKLRSFGLRVRRKEDAELLL
jgi:hypothetical protein